MLDDLIVRNVPAFITGAGTVAGLFGIFISWRNYKRARDIDGTRLFWDLRKDAISEPHLEYMRETARLLLDHHLKSEAIPATPAISRVLNHFEWVGFFVKNHVITKEQASSTFGNNILHLYPALFGYIRKRREEEQYRSLWENVDYLFKQLAKYANKHHNYGSQSGNEIQKMERFIAKHSRTSNQLEHFFRSRLQVEPNKDT